MTDTPWTSGPWRVGEVIANSPSTRVDAGDMEPVAWVYEVPDAELIASAPEMAELLTICMSYDLVAPLADEIHALLARIRGETT